MSTYQKSKGPAEAATSPSHGSTHPSKDQDMNAHTDSIATAQTSTHIVSGNNLRQLSMRHLLDLYCAVLTIRETAYGLANQPRFSTSQVTYEPNAAGNELEALCDHIGEYVQTIVDTASEASPTDPAEVERRAFLIIRHEAQCHDSLSRLSVMAAQFTDDLANAETLHRIRRTAQ